VGLTTMAGRRRRRGAAAFAAVVGAVALAVPGCGPGGGDDAGAQDRGARVEGTTGTGATDAPAGTVRSGSGAGSHFDRDRSDASSDLEHRVSETLSDLDAVARGGDTVIVLPEEVLFEFDRADLRPDAPATLDRIAEAITYFEGAPVRVSGHTDSRGSERYNQDLSRRRAQSVVDYLVGAGVESGRLTAQGFGETRPVASNENADGSDNPGGRARNRRVEVVIQGVDPADVGG